MALNIGELVGTIRADDQGWRHGLREAQLRLAGFTRQADGSLRDMHGRVRDESDAMGRTLGARIGRGANEAVNALKKVAPAAIGIGAGLPVVAAVGAALGGLAAGAVAAGLAVKAFQLAAKPQLEAVTEASEAASKADDAAEKVLLKKKIAADLAAKGGDAYKAALKDVESAQRAATEADAAAEAQLKGLPPATRATAVAFAGLKSDYEDWSDSLSGTTMPLFTKGIELLRTLLPTLTPFVRAASSALGDMLNRVAIGVRSVGFKQWAADMSAASGPALSDFITVIGNLGKGFMGLLQAFLPVSGQMTGGLVAMTAAFADWGASLKGSAGFAEFLDTAGEGGQLLGTLAKAALTVLVALSPLIGVTVKLATGFAEIINATPEPVITALATVITALVIGMKLWAAAQAIVAVRNRIWTATQWQLNAAFLANPITWIIVAIVALIAVIVLIATKTTWFQTAWTYVWNAVKTAFSTAVAGIMVALDWLGQLPGKIATWFGQAKDWALRKSLELVVWLQGLPGRIIGAISSLAGRLATTVSAAFVRFRDAAAVKAVSFVAWVKGIPGRIISALGDLGSLLVGKGKDVVRGLLSGIQSMGGWLKGQLISFAKGMIPGPIAKALGISSPSKLMAKSVGRWIPAGIVQGIDAGTPALTKTMAGLVTPPSVGSMAAGGASYGGRGAGGQPITVRFTSDGGQVGDTLLGLVQERIQVRGGNVQAVLGAN